MRGALMVSEGVSGNESDILFLQWNTRMGR